MQHNFIGPVCLGMRSTGQSVAGARRPQWLCTAGCVGWPRGATWTLPLAAVEADALQLGLQFLDPLVLGHQLVLEALHLCRLALVGLAQLHIEPQGPNHERQEEPRVTCVRAKHLYADRLVARPRLA